MVGNGLGQGVSLSTSLWGRGHSQETMFPEILRFGGRRQLGESFLFTRSHKGAAGSSPKVANVCAHATLTRKHNPTHLRRVIHPGTYRSKTGFGLGGRFHAKQISSQDFHMKGLFLPKCALLGCMLMWSNPISEFSAGPGTGFSGLGSGCWLRLGRQLLSLVASRPWAALRAREHRNGSGEPARARGSITRVRAREMPRPWKLDWWHREPHVGGSECQSAQKKLHPSHTEDLWGASGPWAGTVPLYGL